MFLAIIVGILVQFFIKIEGKGIKIKMPAAVPPAVSGPFES